MAFTGFDPALVNTSIGNVQNAYNSLITALVNDTQSKFVDGMATAWACNDAKTFFSNFGPAINSHVSEATRIFQSVADAMNSAATAWASKTDTTYSKKTFTTSTAKVDVSGIQENINGVRGIDYESAKSTLATLAQVKAAADNALESAKNAVSNCGFVGGQQETYLIGSLTTIKTNISNAFDELKSAAETAINNTVSTYGDTQGQIETSFSGN